MVAQVTAQMIEAVARIQSLAQVFGGLLFFQRMPATNRFRMIPPGNSVNNLITTGKMIGV
jgi:hypothetical protein